MAIKITLHKANYFRPLVTTFFPKNSSFFDVTTNFTYFYSKNNKIKNFRGRPYLDCVPSYCVDQNGLYLGLDEGPLVGRGGTLQARQLLDQGALEGYLLTYLCSNEGRAKQAIHL